jgi:beta-1,4-mannosyl-glycoprotein beta-1,4-N-acetylglucosaminyltransferase
MKKIEAFPFYNELDLLEIRLAVTADYVDYWVISESNKTFAGKDKPFYLKDNLDTRFSKYKDRIIRVEYDCGSDAWSNEFESRNSLGRYLLSAFNSNDIVIMSDCDEVPDYRKVTFTEDLPAILETKGYYYFLNCKQNLDFQVVSMFNVSTLNQIETYRMRACAGNYKTIIKDAGWHWSFLGGPEKIKEKIEAYAHQDMNTPDIVNIKNIEEAIDNFKDIFGRSSLSYSTVLIDESFPPYIVKNQKKYIHLIKNEY